MSKLPPRSANTMSDAIALSSPSGRMSKRARAAAERKLAQDLFGGYERPKPPQPSRREVLLRNAAMWRDLAARGMRPRKFKKMAEEAEAEAAALLEGGGNE